MLKDCRKCPSVKDLRRMTMVAGKVRSTGHGISGTLVTSAESVQAVPRCIQTNTLMPQVDHLDTVFSVFQKDHHFHERSIFFQLYMDFDGHTKLFR